MNFVLKIIYILFTKQNSFSKYITIYFIILIKYIDIYLLNEFCVINKMEIIY